MARYGKAAGREVATEMRHKKTGKHTVTSRAQAIAIGLSKARRKGAKVPAKPRAGRRASGVDRT